MLVQIMRGAYLDVTDAPADTSRWLARRIVTIARAFALASQVNQASSLLFTGECAGMIRGIAVRSSTPDILYRLAGPRKHKRRLPPVMLNGMKIPAVQALHVTGGMSVRPSEFLQIGTLRLAASVVMIADSARREHREQAFVLACMTLTRETSFDKFAPTLALRKTQEIRVSWMERAKEIRGRRAYRVLVAVLLSMRTGIDSPLEAMVLWALTCLLPKHVAEKLTNQQEVVTARGDLYFLDFALPARKFAWEADGRVKYGGGLQASEAYKSKHTNRHQDLMDAGWTIRRLTFDDVSGPDSLDRVHGHLERMGLVPETSKPRPRGNLFQPRSSEYLQQVRR